MSNDVKLFEGNRIRSIWNNEKEEWYFSIIDAVNVLTDSRNAGAYWRKLKQRLKEDGSEVVTFCHALKLKSPKDGKMYKTDVTDMQGLFRIIPSIPSPKAEHLRSQQALMSRKRKSG